METVTLIVKALVAVALLLGLVWVVRQVLSGGREAKGRKGRKGGQDRRVEQKGIARERRKGPRRQQDVAKEFMNEIEGS